MWLLPLETTFNHKTWNLFKALNIELSLRTIFNEGPSLMSTVLKMWLRFGHFPEENTTTQMMMHRKT